MPAGCGRSSKDCWTKTRAGASPRTRHGRCWRPWPLSARSPPKSAAANAATPTAIAPSPTLAAPTALQEADGPTVTAHTVLIPGMGRRLRTAWVVAGAAAAVLLLGGGFAWAASGRASGDDQAAALPSSSASARALTAAAPSSAPPSGPVNPLLDSCLVGRWRSTSIQVVNHFEGVKTRFSGGKGVILRIWPDGRTHHDFNKSSTLTATIGGAKYVETLRGTESSRTETRKGRTFGSEYSAKRTLKVTRNGRTVLKQSVSSPGGGGDYLCSDTRLTFDGDEDSSTDSFERLSRTP